MTAINSIIQHSTTVALWPFYHPIYGGYIHTVNRLLASQKRISWSVLLANKIGEEFTECPVATHALPLHAPATEVCEAQEEISLGTTVKNNRIVHL